MDRIGKKLAAVLASRWFYRGVLAFFVLEALWIALSAMYPMAFDEDFHFGVIGLYADVWLPFLPPDAGSSGQYGAVTRDPSFLFHWLMSFPYRLVNLFTDNQAAIVIFLRVINIALFAMALVLFRRFMLAMGRSPGFSNTVLALFVLIPVVPLLAGQISYDNLIMVFTAWTCLLVASLYQGFRRRDFSVRQVALLAIVCIFAVLTKYTFLPIALAAVLFCAVACWLSFRGSGMFVKAVAAGYKTMGISLMVGLAALIVVGLGLAAERYAVNALRYNSVFVQCHKVLSVEQCHNFGAWGRDYRLAQNRNDETPNPVYYTAHWLQALHMRLFFMINGPHHDYRNYPPPPIISNAATALIILSFAALLLYGWPVVRGNPVLGFVLLMTLIYAVALWLNTYSAYVRTGEPVAINGRYLIPVLLPLAAMAGAAFGMAARGFTAAKAYVAVIAITLFLQAGGVFSFIIRSDATWYWDSRLVNQVNDAARQAIDPLMIEGSTEFKKEF